MKIITGKIGKIVKAVKTGEIGGKADSRLRRMCDRLSPQKRICVVAVSLAAFAVLAVYMAISAVYGTGRAELNIEHIEGVKLQRSTKDSINLLKIEHHDDFRQ